MATILKNILQFTALTVGVPISLPHRLNKNSVAEAPRIGGANAAGFEITADKINVTVTRTAAALVADVRVYVEIWHSIEEALPLPGKLTGLTPFFFHGGETAAAEIEEAYDATEFEQNTRLARLEDALAGSLALVILPPNPEDVVAADLNAAAAGSFTRVFTAELQTTAGAVHEWAAFIPTLVPSEVVVDPDVGPPTIVGVPTFAAGFLTVELIFDTDAGATKTYAPGDVVTVQVKVSPTDTLLGYTVASVTKTYNVI